MTSKAPFNILTLYSKAFKILKFDPTRTINAAKHLYEAGYITHMDTTSHYLTGNDIKKIKEYIIKTFGRSDYNEINYGTTSDLGHHAIIPITMNVANVEPNIDQKIGEDELMLYNLIWR